MSCILRKTNTFYGVPKGDGVMRGPHILEVMCSINMRLVSGTCDATAKFSDIHSWKAMQTFVGHKSDINTIMLSELQSLLSPTQCHDKLLGSHRLISHAFHAVCTLMAILLQNKPGPFLRTEMVAMTAAEMRDPTLDIPCASNGIYMHIIALAHTHGRKSGGGEWDPDWAWPDSDTLDVEVDGVQIGNGWIGMCWMGMRIELLGRVVCGCTGCGSEWGVTGERLDWDALDVDANRVVNEWKDEKGQLLMRASVV
ncbi:hypothetical protein JB92DRAFT_2836634 [Gautieria morchelliformis]|nr:hypothetical protein JB92DRAFT_2836634 [Gautieria morchelliformis]